MNQWRPALFLSIIIIAGFGFTGYMIRGQSKGAREGGPSPELIKQLAADLESKNLWEQAADAYSFYLRKADLRDKERAKASYHLGSLYLERLNLPEKALPRLLMAKKLAGDGGVGPDADKLVVAALEKLGRSIDAGRYLSEAASIDSPKKSANPPETVVAKIGDKEITLDELEEEIQALPPQLQSRMNGPNGKSEMLQSLVVKELMLRAAIREGLDENPEIEKIAQRAKEAAIISSYQQREIENKIRITDPDVRAYYESHKDNFVKKDENGKARQLSYEEAKEQARMALLNDRRRSLMDELLNRLQQAQKVEIYSDKIFGQQ